MTKWQLFSALGGKAYPDNRSLIDCNDSQGIPRFGYLQSIQREDCSGSSFNVTISPYHGGDSVTFHIRTSD